MSRAGMQALTVQEFEEFEEPEVPSGVPGWFALSRRFRQVRLPAQDELVEKGD